MRTIIVLSHNHHEVEFKDAWPEPHPPSRRIHIKSFNHQDREIVTIHEMDLFDVQQLIFFP